MTKGGFAKDSKRRPAAPATVIWCATSPLLAAGGGVYCEDYNIALAVPADDPSFTGIRLWGYRPSSSQALVDDVGEARWRIVCDLGIAGDERG